MMNKHSVYIYILKPRRQRMKSKAGWFAPVVFLSWVHAAWMSEAKRTANANKLYK